MILLPALMPCYGLKHTLPRISPGSGHDVDTMSLMAALSVIDSDDEMNVSAVAMLVTRRVKRQQNKDITQRSIWGM